MSYGRHSIRTVGRAQALALALILLLGLGLRLDYAWEGREPVYDAVAYAQIAANLERGEGFTVGETATQRSSNYSPGLPLVVTGLYRITGGVHERLARIVLALVGTLAVLFAFLIGGRLSGPIAGLIGAAVVAIYPALLEYGGMLMSEPLATTLLAGAVLAILWAADREGWMRWALPGVLLGALALTRPEYLAVSALLAVVVALRGIGGGWRPALGQAAVLLAGIVLIVAPWTVRNAVALDRFVPISTGGGQVLFAGSYLPSDGDPEKVGREVLERHPGLTRELAAQYGAPGAGIDAILSRARLEQILAALASQRYPGLETDRALARMGRERLWDDITGEPIPYAGFLAAKTWRVWGHGPREVMRRPVWEILQWALLVLGIAGAAVLIAGRRWDVVPILTVIVAITATSLVLVATPRRALVMLPLTAALAGVGAVACGDSLARRWNG
jgi:4-amino-4-deoxy-L-arabinose transferase-like glycosyltransferase